MSPNAKSILRRDVIRQGIPLPDSDCVNGEMPASWARAGTDSAYG